MGAGDRWEHLAAQMSRVTVPRRDLLIAALVLAVLWVPPIIAAGGWVRACTGIVLAALTGAALVLTRRAPVVTTAVVAATTLVGTAAGVCQDPMLATAWCLYLVAVERGPHARALVITLVGVLAGLAAATAVSPGLGTRVVMATAALCLAWLVGTAVGRQVASAREAERMRVQLNMARDMHDVVGHALGVIAAEAGVTRGLPDAPEAELRGALADIESHARDALEEVQGLVRTLRDPGPGLSGLPAIIATTRAAGVAVHARLEPHGPVDAEVGAAVVRIAQEALSNVVRHAPEARCTVELWESEDTIALRVRDSGAPGTAPVAPGTGYGLRGMRERAAALGGTVAWGGTAAGGFEVEARLPMRRS
ncbi:sensor histidine kinase [Actinopolymorpha pittospori]|uniref:histidine kinase n=1 Tax=Actinopolymorpha pittospori TaxID=648752 RepID=A0A927MUR5_9ACTN|nr:histidine kinase [Actinopolymorpha pittospori]MBE1607251.1 signal transduction histidine kinase [Actinopolymorpha pittospori]